MLSPFSENLHLLTIVTHISHLAFLQCRYVCSSLHPLQGFVDPLRLQASTCSLDEKKWLVEKFKLYKEHHAKKTLGQFFPPLYEEYFASWPPIPTAEGIEAAGGNKATATAKVRTTEEHVCCLDLSAKFPF